MLLLEFTHFSHLLHFVVASLKGHKQHASNHVFMLPELFIEFNLPPLSDLKNIHIYYFDKSVRLID